MQSKISAHHKGCQEAIDSVRSRMLEAEYALVEKVYILRKNQVKELWGTVTETYDGDRTELWVSYTSYPIKNPQKDIKAKRSYAGNPWPRRGTMTLRLWSRRKARDGHRIRFRDTRIYSSGGDVPDSGI